MKHLITLKDGTQICTGDYVDFVGQVVHKHDHSTTPRGGAAYIGAAPDVETDNRACMSVYNNGPMELMMTLGRLGAGVTMATSYGGMVAQKLEELVETYNTKDLGPCIIMLGPLASEQVSPEFLAELAERG